MSQYRFDLYRPDLQRQVAELQKVFWGSSMKLNTAYLEWKYSRNPYTPEPLAFVAMHGSRLVGMRGIFGSCWEVGNRPDTIILPCTADTLIEPDFRGGSLYRELTDFMMAELCTRGYTHTISLSATPANYLISVMGMGYRPVGSLGIMTRRNPTATAGSKLIRQVNRFKFSSTVQRVGMNARRALGLNVFSDLDRNAGSGSAGAGFPVILAEKPRPEAMADLVLRLNRDERIRHVRGRSYFSWRFENPRASYRFLYWGSEHLSGYLVLQNTKGKSPVNIVDWEASDPEVLTGLFRSALAWGQFPRIETWNATLPSAKEELLRESGFSAIEDIPGTPRHYGRFLLRTVGKVEDDRNWCLHGRQLLKLCNWDLRMIYSDGF
jgi:hypothetical protein